MIAHDNILRLATILSEDTAAGFPFSNALTGRTSEQAGFAVGASRAVVVDNETPKSAEALCVAWHNLGAVSATLTLEGSADNSTYSPITTVPVSNDFVLFHTFASVSYRYYRLTVSDHTGAAYIGDVFVGDVLDLPFGPGLNWNQPHQSFDDDILSNVTGAGAIAGVSVVSKPKKAEIEFRDFERSWFDANWELLLDSITRYAAYYLWNTNERPIFFVPVKIDPPKFTTHNRQSAQITIMGLV